MIGDSWTEFHKEMELDSVLEKQLCDLTSRPAKVTSNGKSHKRSRGIYDLMYKTDGYGTKSLIESGADYCIISAGINDAGANLGTNQFCYYMKLIMNLLLTNGITPVIFEVPDVNYWKLFNERPFLFIVKDYLRSIMTGAGMYHYAEYRDALHKMLVEENYMASIVFIDVNKWNSMGDRMDESLFLDDQIHLNQDGYVKLDSCLALYITEDFLNKCDVR
jgi:lysophospholipase L1-like esterase